MIAAVTPSISRMPGTALGAFVANDDDVAGLDGAGLDGGKGCFLALEHPGRSLVPGQRRAGDLHDAAVAARCCRAARAGRRSA